MSSSGERSSVWYQPLDLNATLLVKYLSDLTQFLKKLSPFASVLFIALNYRDFIRNKKALITALLFLPALALTPSFDILRFVFSILVLWIFLRKCDDPYTRFSPAVALIVSLYSILVFAGIFRPDFYVRMDNSFRYKFILETHNALTVYVLFSFVYLINYFLQWRTEKRYRAITVVSFLAILLLCIVLLFIKSRLYLGLSFLLVLILAWKHLRSSKAFLLIPLWYALAFAGLSRISQYVIRPASPAMVAKASERGPAAAATVPAADTATARKMTANANALKPTVKDTAKSAAASKDTARALDLDSIRRQEALKLVDNKRVFSLSGTGREKMLNLFKQVFTDLGWQHFIYQNNTAVYLERKKKIPYINVNASTLTENSYMITLLSTGFLGLLIFLFVFFHFLQYFVRKKAFFSLLYFLLLLAVWFYEETVIYPFSMIAHLFALTTVYRFERKSHEGSPGH